MQGRCSSQISVLGSGACEENDLKEEGVPWESLRSRMLPRAGHTCQGRHKPAAPFFRTRGTTEGLGSVTFLRPLWEPSAGSVRMVLTCTGSRCPRYFPKILSCDLSTMNYAFELFS